MRVESKLRIERIITKDREILLEMEEGTEEAHIRKLKAVHLSLLKQQRRNSKAMKLQKLPTHPCFLKFICLTNEHQKNVVCEIIQSYFKKEIKK